MESMGFNGDFNGVDEEIHWQNALKDLANMGHPEQKTSGNPARDVWKCLGMSGIQIRRILFELRM